jgi:hypothetical protein
MINSCRIFGKPQRRKPFLQNGSWEKWVGDVGYLQLIEDRYLFLGHVNKLLLP